MSSTRALLPPTDRCRALKEVIDCMVYADDDNEYAQAIDALNKLFGEEEGEWDDEIKWYSFSVLCQMHRGLDNERSQKRGRDVLIDLEYVEYVRKDPPYDLFPVRDAIFEFIEIHSEDASATRFGLELINEVHPLVDYVSQNTVDALVNIMVVNEKDPVIQKIAMLNMYDKFESGREMNYSEFLNECVRAMGNHPDNSNVQVAACKALSSFCEEYELITSVQWPPATILQALNNHVHCAEVQESACDFLRYLLWGVQAGREYIEANLPTRVREDFFLAGRDYIEAVLQAMQTHPTNMGVQVFALDVLESITNDSASLNRIIQGGGVDLLIRAMPILEESALGLKPLHILKPLLGYSTDARREAIEVGAIPMLLDVLRRLPCENLFRSISSCIIVCDVLDELFLENIDNAVSLQIANEGGIELIIDSIGEHARHDHIELKDGDILAHLAMFTDNDGRLPLHYAADRGLLPFSEGRMTVLEHLLKVYPEAATVRDGSGRLPLHIAIGWNAPLSMLELLLHATPDAGEAVCRSHDDIMMNFPPVLMAAASDCDLECIFALLRHAPTITKGQLAIISQN